MTLALPRGPGVQALGVTVATGGHTLERIGAARLHARHLRLSFVVPAGGPVTVSLRERRSGRIVTRHHVYEPCTV